MDLKEKIHNYALSGKVSDDTAGIILNILDFCPASDYEKNLNTLCDLISDIDIIKEINEIQKIKGFVYKSPEFEEVKKEPHPFEEPILFEYEKETKQTHKLSFVIETIKNKNHKLENMFLNGVLDASFVRVQKNEEKPKWYYDGSTHARRNDRLTMELESKFQLMISNQANRIFKEYTKKPPMFLDEFLESRMPLTPTRNTNEYKNIVYSKVDARPDFLKFIFSLFGKKKK